MSFLQNKLQSRHRAITPVRGILKHKISFNSPNYEEQNKQGVMEDDVQDPSFCSKGSSHFKPLDSSRVVPPVEIVSRQKSTQTQPGKLNRVWRDSALNIIYYISRFSRQLRTSAGKIKFKLLTKRMLELISDKASDSTNLIMQRNNQFKKKSQDSRRLDCVLEFFQQLPIIEPDSLFKIVWDILMVVAIVVNILYIPLELSFGVDSDSTTKLILNTIPSWLFLVDILFTFQTAYYAKGIIHRKQSEIIPHYVKGKLLFDIIVVIPLLLAQFDIPYLQFTLLLRVFRVQGMLQNLEEILNMKEDISLLFQLVKLVFQIIIMCHFCACVWAFIGEVQTQHSWMIYYEINNANWDVKYIYSIYFSIITTLTIGYGDLSPQTNVERIYAVFVALFVCGVLGYTISKIGDIFKLMSEKEVAFKSKMAVLTRYMKARKLNKQLQLQVRKYFEHFVKIEQESNTQAEEMMQQLTKRLKEQVAIDFYFGILKQSRVIRENICDSCIKKLCLYVHESKYAPEDVIWYEGESANKLIFIQKGEIQQLANDTILNNTKKGVLGEREFAISNVYSTKVIAIKFTQVAYINYEDFITVIKEHQEDLEKFSMVRENLMFNENYRTFGQVCEICQWTHQLKNCPFAFVNINKNKLVKQFKQSKEQIRLPLDRSYYRFKSKSKLAETQECSLAFILNEQILEQSALTDQYLQTLGFVLDDSKIDMNASLVAKNTLAQDTNINESNTYRSASQTEQYQRINSDQVSSDHNNALAIPPERLANMKNAASPQRIRTQKKNSSGESNHSIQSRRKVQFNFTSDMELPLRSLRQKNSANIEKRLSIIPVDQNSFISNFRSQTKLSSITKDDQSRAIASKKNISMISNTSYNRQSSIKQKPALVNDMLQQLEEEHKEALLRIDFDIDKQYSMVIYFPTYNFDEVVKKVQVHQETIAGHNKIEHVGFLHEFKKSRTLQRLKN